ncbi:MAG: hypothetical protein WC755_01570 [Candidatus Woesearchaeota archaeon]|jgi:hypothetical protein
MVYKRVQTENTKGKVSLFLLLLFVLLFSNIIFSQEIVKSVTIRPDGSSSDRGGSTGIGENTGSLKDLSNVMSQIFFDYSETGVRAQYHWVFRILLMLLLVSITFLPMVRTKMGNTAASRVTVMIVSFISCVFISTENLLWLFDLVSTCLILGSIIYILKYFLEKLGVLSSTTGRGLIFVIIGILLLGTALGYFLAKFPPVAKLLSVNMWSIPIIKILVGALGIFCIVYGLGKLFPDVQLKIPFLNKGAARAAAIERVAGQMPDLETELLKLRNESKGMTGSNEEVSAILQKAESLEKRIYDLKRESAKAKYAPSN